MVAYKDIAKKILLFALVVLVYHLLVGAYITRVGGQYQTVFIKNIADGNTDLLDFTLPSAGMGSLWIVGSLAASNGTDHQARQFNLRVSAVNKAGTMTSQVQILNNTQQSFAGSSGTLVLNSASPVLGAGKITVRINTTGNLTETIYQVRFAVMNLSGHKVTIL